MKVLLVDEVHENLAQKFKGLGWECQKAYEWSREEVLEHIHEFDGMIIRSKFKVTEDLIQRATNLKFIGRSGAGMEIPADAVLKDGSWHYKPHLPILPMLKLVRTPEAGDYQLCVSSTQAGQQCHSMSYWVGEPTTEQPSIELWGCDIPS